MRQPLTSRACVQFALTIFAALTFSFAAAAEAADQPASSSDGIRQRIEQQRLQKQIADRELILRQGAAAVAVQRVQELQKQLEDAQLRAQSETAQVQNLQQQAALIGTQLAEMTASIPLHEAADSLVQIADKASVRLTALTLAQHQLRDQLASLRKSSVEWRSKATDAEQQLATIAAQRPELDKKINEAKVASDAADAALAAAQTAQTVAQTAFDAASSTLSQEEERLVSATASVGKLANSVVSLQNSLSTLQVASKLAGTDASAAIQGLEKAIADFAPLKVNTDALLTTVTVRRDEQAARLVVARADLEKKAAESQAALAAAEPLRAALKTAADAVAAAIVQETGLKKSKSESDAWQKTLTAQLTGLEPSLQKLTAETQIVSTETLVARRGAEKALEPLGRFVSYSRHVAPILAQRCVACHNTRSAGGRLNLDSFAAMLKGGESGEAVIAHKSGGSLLVTMIEDGTMPKEADPLTPEEIAVVKHWIDVGAPLDAGVTASADLFEVMPELAQPLPPKEYRVAIPVTAVAFSPDGTQLASSGYHEVLIWNTADGSLLRRITNVAERIYDLEFSADGSSLAVAAGTPGQLGELKLFAAADGQFIRTLVRARDAVFAVSFSPDGQLIASAGADRSISVVRAATGDEVTRIEDHADWVMDINWSPNGQRLVSSSRDKTCKVFEAATGNPVITFSGHGEPVYTAAFLADSLTVVSGGSDKKLRVWNSADAKEIRAVGGFAGDIFRLQILPGDQVLSASGDRNIHQHNAADGAELRQMAGHADWVYTLSAHPGLKRIASGSYDGEIRIWNSEDGSMTTSFIAIPKTAAEFPVAVQ